MIKKLADDDCIRISWYTSCTECLGPGKRFALWLQGCDRNCRDCISPENQPFDGGYCEKCDNIVSEILKSGMNGITVSGGEPFYQADRLIRILEAVRNEKSSFGVIIYTGFHYDEIIGSNDPYAVKLLREYTDILIDGPYISELDDDIGLRGSSNQNVIAVSDRYSDEMKCYDEPSGRKSSFELTGKKLQMTGIPSAAVKSILRVSGHFSGTS